MKASELIKELQERIELYGDWGVQIRTEDDDVDVGSVYADDEAERIIVSTFVWEEQEV